MTATVTEPQNAQPTAVEPQPAPKSAAPERAPRAPEHNASVLESLLEQPMKYRMALEPTTFDEGWRVAQIVAKLKLCQVASPEDGYARILTGRSIGLPAMASIQGIALIYQQKQDCFVPCMYAKVKLALALSRKDVIEYIRPKTISDTESIWVGKRVGQPDEQEYKFTWEDAKRAQLVGRGGGAEGGNNYDRHPKAMLSWRACGRLCDIIAADVLNGIATREEVQDEADRPEPSDAIPAPPAQAAPARDFAAEAAALKSDITEAFAREDGATKKALREAFKKFETEAPASVVDDVKAHYNQEVAKAKASKGAPAPVSPTALPGQQSLVPSTAEPAVGG